MELSAEAHPDEPSSSHPRFSAQKDMFTAGKDASLLAAGKFWTQIRATQKRGELAATAIIMVCGAILSCLLALANATDAIASLRR